MLIQLYIILQMLKKIINLITDKLFKFKVTNKLKGGNSGNLH